MKKIIKKIIILFIPIELYEHAKFEFRSKLGRILSRSLKLNSTNANYINLGSGKSYVNNFINVDFFGNKKIDYGMDLRFPFKIESNSIDGIFSEHTFEHLSHLEVDNALSECCRILKPEAKIRIIVPDLSILIERYSSNDDEWFQKWHDLVLKDPSRHYMKKYFTNMFAINFTASYYHHKSCWDFESLKKVLTSNGFVNIEKCNYNLGTPELLIDSDSEDRKLVSIYIEGKKGS
jgi:predicted SAM-dependent methyltransferase